MENIAQDMIAKNAKIKELENIISNKLETECSSAFERKLNEQQENINNENYKLNLKTKELNKKELKLKIQEENLKSKEHLIKKYLDNLNNSMHTKIDYKINMNDIKEKYDEEIKTYKHEIASVVNDLNVLDDKECSIDWLNNSIDKLKNNIKLKNTLLMYCYLYNAVRIPFTYPICQNI